MKMDNKVSDIIHFIGEQVTDTVAYMAAAIGANRKKYDTEGDRHNGYNYKLYNLLI